MVNGYITEPYDIVHLGSDIGVHSYVDSCKKIASAETDALC